MATRDAKLDLRLSADAKRRLHSAAAAAHTTVSQYVLESALSRAEGELADRRVFPLNDERWDALIEALDGPPRHAPRLDRLLNEPGFFDAT